MKVADALAYFGGERGAKTRLAQALGLSSGAVSQWGEVVPEGQAYKLESLTRGKLKVDPVDYRKGSHVEYATSS